MYIESLSKPDQSPMQICFYDGTPPRKPPFFLLDKLFLSIKMHSLPRGKFLPIPVNMITSFLQLFLIPHYHSIINSPKQKNCHFHCTAEEVVSEDPDMNCQGKVGAQPGGPEACVPPPPPPPPSHKGERQRCTQELGLQALQLAFQVLCHIEQFSLRCLSPGL